MPRRAIAEVVAVGEHHARARVMEHELDIGRREGPADPDPTGTESHGREERDDEIDPVRRRGRDRGAAAHPQLGEDPSRAADLVVELAVREPPCLVDERRRARIAGDGGGEELTDGGGAHA